MTMAQAYAAARIEPTDADLHLAWQRCRRADWPPTFEDAMADPVLSRLVRLNASHPAAPQLRVVRHPWPFMASPKHRGEQPPAPAAQPVFDLKRAAAGDRDD